MEEDESRGYEVAGHLPAAPGVPALADGPAEQETERHQVEDGHAEGGDTNHCGLLEPHAGNKLSVRNWRHSAGLTENHMNYFFYIGARILYADNMI